jgi:hypothetical protein
MNNETLMLIFVGLTAFALLAEAIILLALFLAVRKVSKTVEEHIVEVKGTLMPVLTKSREVIDRVSPKVESMATDLSQLAHNLHEQGIEIQASTSDILERVHRQTTRVDGMFTNLADGVEHAGQVMTDTVTKPVRQVAAVVAAAKAFVSVLASGRRRTGEPRVADQDMFV